MNTAETIRKFNDLRLFGIAKRYQSIIDLSPREDLPDLHTAAAMFADAQTEWQNEKRTLTNIKNARLRYRINPQEIECSSARGLSREVWMLLCEGRYIKEGINIVILGATGVGKSAIACALGRQACITGYKVRYFNMNRLIEDVKAAKLEGSYLRFLDQIAKVPLLILDDFGLKSLDKDMRVAFYEILEDRAGKTSTIITSQFPIANWYDKFGDKTLAEACLDRITGNAQKINLAGKSRRSKNNESEIK